MASEETLQLPSLELKTKAGSAVINTREVSQQCHLSIRQKEEKKKKKKRQPLPSNTPRAPPLHPPLAPSSK